MSGVAIGSPVSAANTNSAFLDANGDDTAVGKITLANGDTASGTTINNIQAELNSEASYTGKPVNSAKDVLPTWTNNQIGTSADTLRARADALSLQFDSTAGHIHDGTTGNAPKILAGNIASVPLEGVYIQGTDISGVTGSSSNVSSLLTGQVPSSNNTTKGVVVNSPYNLVFVRQATGAGTNDEFKDGSGNVIYGRLSFSSSVWTLTFYVRLSGVETVYSFGSSSNVRWYYQKLFDRIVDAPVYSDLSNIPSDNATADVIDATESSAGKVLLSNIVATSVGTSNVKGTGTRVSKEDHAHQGLHSVAEFVDATQVFGDIVLKAGSSANVTITRSGNTFTFDATGGVGYQEVPAGPVNGTNATFGPLTNLPSSAQSVIVFVDGLPVDKANWSLSGSSIIFSSNIPVSGQDVYCFYLSAGVPAVPPTPTGTLHTEYRTITSTEATNKIINLANTPADLSGCLVDILDGGGAEEFNVDYTIVTNQFRWSGYGLDGLLATGDRIRFHYIT